MRWKPLTKSTLNTLWIVITTWTMSGPSVDAQQESRLLLFELSPQETHFLGLPDRPLEEDLCDFEDQTVPEPPDIDQILLEPTSGGGGPSSPTLQAFLLDRDPTSTADDESLITPVRFCSTSIQPIETSCGTWSYTVALDETTAETTGLPPGGLLTFSRDLDGGGTVRGNVALRLRVRLQEHGSGRIVEFVEEANFLMTGDWSEPPPEDVDIDLGLIAVDTDCDGTEDSWAPATSNLYVGWTPTPDGPVAGSLCGAGERGAGWFCLTPYRPTQP